MGKEEQAEVKDETNAEKLANICGIDMNTWSPSSVSPSWMLVMNGYPWVISASSVSGIGHKIYENLFQCIIEKCNETLFDTTMKKVQDNCCLNIADFDIFDRERLDAVLRMLKLLLLFLLETFAQLVKMSYLWNLRNVMKS